MAIEASYPSKISNIFFNSLKIKKTFLLFPKKIFIIELSKKKFARKFLGVFYYTFAHKGKCVKKHIRIILLEIQLLLIKALYRK